MMPVCNVAPERSSLRLTPCLFALLAAQGAKDGPASQARSGNGLFRPQPGE